MITVTFELELVFFIILLILSLIMWISCKYIDEQKAFFLFFIALFIFIVSLFGIHYYLPENFVTEYNNNPLWMLLAAFITAGIITVGLFIFYVLNAK